MGTQHGAGSPETSEEFLHEDRGPGVIAANVVLIVLTTLVFCLRLLTKYTAKISWGRDDTYIVLGYLFNFALNVVCAVMVPWAGVGMHIEENLRIDPSRLTHELKGLMAAIWLYGIASFLPKMAILELYLRLFHPRPFRWLCYFAMALVTGSAIAIVLVQTFQCTPVEFFWDKTIEGHCIDTQAFFRWASLPHIVTDLMVLFLPIPLIVKLQISRSRRLQLLGVFILGGAGLITSIVRFALFHTTDAISDPTWASGSLLIITCIEPGCYFICACLPGLQHLVRDVKNRFTRGSARYSVASQSSRRQGFQKMNAYGKNGAVPLDSLAGDRQWLGRDEP